MTAGMPAPVYLDCNATTPVDPWVVEAMLPYLREHYGNPSSDHAYGHVASTAVARARAEVAALIGARPEEIVFTGSATEANNLALWGAAKALLPTGRRRLLTSAVEHASVAMPLRTMSRCGWTLEELPVDGSGRLLTEEALAAIDEQTALVSVMLANNETGSLQPVQELSPAVRAHGALLHVDAAQAVGKIAVDVEALACDLLTLAGHKLYAPKGVGALYVRTGTPLEPIMQGAGHEGGRRPGTENVPHIVALGAAARLARETLGREVPDLRALRDALHTRLSDAIPGLVLNGHPSERLPGTLNVSFPGVAGWALLAEARSVAASTGTACHAAEHTLSRVLAAMGCTPERAIGAVRLSLGRYTTAVEIDTAASALIAAWRRLQ